ncbi:helix-turn-helix domain-containing protein, partial [Streptomyces caatingaensis]|uniref:helix-turn-helix domain-containing protein n=1 Tax=Streptomyces caatingaensis TaxID=1678637 RepID=UPI000B327CA3
MPSRQELSELIRHACEERGWGPTKLAREVSIAAGRPPGTLERQYARRWLNGERAPRHWLPYVAQVLNLDLETSGKTCTAGSGAKATDNAASVSVGRVHGDRPLVFHAPPGKYLLSKDPTAACDTALRAGGALSPGQCPPQPTTTRSLGDGASASPS